MQRPNSRWLSLTYLLAGLMLWNGVAVAQTAWVNGPWAFTDDYDDYAVTFDGLGGYSGTISNSQCSTTAPTSGTYTVSSAGQVAIEITQYQNSICLGGGTTTTTVSGQLAINGQEILGLNVIGARAPSFGQDNFAAGVQALGVITSGSSNVAVGSGALAANTTGSENNASGTDALTANTTGTYNNAVGFKAMIGNTTGYNNNAQGSYALSANTTGYGNSAMGANSFLNLVSGCRNVGVGNNTGTALTNAGLTAAPYDCYNTYIGWGVPGTEGDSGVTVIGNSTYATATYIAGVYSATTGGNAVCVSNKGQLSGGVSCASPSSRRYKEDIQLLTDAERLMALEPVSYRYRKPDASGNKPLEYGLIAEQVAEVYPELVAYDEQGRPDAVRYQDLTPLLIRKVQEQQAQLQEQAGRLQQQENRLQEQDTKLQEMSELRDRLAALETQVREQVLARAGSAAAAERVAMR